MLNKTIKVFLLPGEKRQTPIYILYDVVSAFCICNPLAGCFAFFLLLHYFLRTSPAFSFWQHIWWCFRVQRLDLWLWLMVLIWVGSSGTARAGVSLLCSGGCVELLTSWGQQPGHAQATETNLPLHLFLARVTLFIWVDSWMAGSQSRSEHFALWDHPFSFSFVILKGSFPAKVRLWNKFSGHQGLQWELNAYGLSNGDLWALHLSLNTTSV